VEGSGTGTGGGKVDESGAVFGLIGERRKQGGILYGGKERGCCVSAAPLARVTDYFLNLNSTTGEVCVLLNTTYAALHVEA
jgi:hypothetical protein